MKPGHLPTGSKIRIWFWNQAGAQSFICEVHEAKAIKERLISEGAVVWHTTMLNA